MAGGAEGRARTAFSETLVEQLVGKDLEQIKPLKTLDEGVAGYIFELHAVRPPPDAKLETDQEDDIRSSLVELLKASLYPLPKEKPRVAHSSTSPHEALQLILDPGIDLYDAYWAQRAANIGIALDFRFPVTIDEGNGLRSCGHTRRRGNGKYDLGHNLFSTKYAHDHSSLASSLLDSNSAAQYSTVAGTVTCPCAACSPLARSSYVVHSEFEKQNPAATGTIGEMASPYTRSYIHHLLHTHEMSSHSLLVMHNLAVVDAFFAGVRDVLARGSGERSFAEELDLFTATYDEPPELLHEAESEWARVESERGKGRLAREKEKRA